jgi:threonine dehydratase
MPSISPPPKIAATRGYGAKVIFSGSTSVEREAVCAQVMADTGARLVPPYDHPDIVLGQGTLALELLEDSAQEMAGENKKQLDMILAPCGGGGMLSGVAVACEGTGTRVFGCEPSFAGADDAKRGYEAGRRVEAVHSLTVADGLRTPLGEVPWSVLYERRLVAGFFSVGEDDIKRALRLVLERAKLVIEPSAAVPLAVALFNEDFRAMVEREFGAEGAQVGVVFSGGNLDLEVAARLFGAGEKKE